MEQNKLIVAMSPEGVSDEWVEMLLNHKFLPMDNFTTLKMIDDINIRVYLGHYSIFRFPFISSMLLLSCPYIGIYTYTQLFQ